MYSEYTPEDNVKKRGREESYASKLGSDNFRLIEMELLLNQGHALFTSLPRAEDMIECIKHNNISSDDEKILNAVNKVLSLRPLNHGRLQVLDALCDFVMSTPESVWHKPAVRHIAALFCKCSRGLWIQLEDKLVKAEADNFLFLLTELQVLEDVKVEIMRTATQWYNEARSLTQNHYDACFNKCTDMFANSSDLITARSPYTGSDVQATSLLQREMKLMQAQSRLIPRNLATPATPAVFTNSNSTPTAARLIRREPIFEATGEDLRKAEQIFHEQRGHHTVASLYDHDEVTGADLTHLNAMLEQKCNEVAEADEHLFYSTQVLVHGDVQWQQSGMKREELLDMGKLVISYGLKRAGLPSDSPHCDTTDFPSNRVYGKLDDVETLSQIIFSRDAQNKAGELMTVLIDLQDPVLVGSVGTYDQGSTGVGILPEFSRIIAHPTMSVGNDVSVMSSKKTVYSTMAMQFLHPVRASELNKPDVTPLICCLLGIPSGLNADPVTSACLYYCRKWAAEMFGPSTVLTELHWRIPPRGVGGEYRSRVEVIGKVIFLGGDGTDARQHPGYLAALAKLSPTQSAPWKLALPGGYRLEVHRSLSDARATAPRIPWIAEPTPNFTMYNISPRATARDVFHWLAAVSENVDDLKKIASIVMVRAVQYGFDADNLKSTENMGILIFEDESFVPRTKFIERETQGVMTFSQASDLPGRDKIKEECRFFPLLNKHTPAIRPGAQPAIHNNLKANAMAANFNSPSLARSFMTPSTTTFSVPMSVEMTPTPRGVPLSVVRYETPSSPIDTNSLVKSSLNHEMVKLLTDMSLQLSELKDEVGTLRQTVTSQQAQLEEAKVKQIAYEAKQQDLESSFTAAIGGLRTEVIAEGRRAENARIAGQAQKAVKDAHLQYMDAKRDWESAHEDWTAVASSGGTKETKEHRDLKKQLTRCEAVLASRRALLSSARQELIDAAGDVSIDAFLSQYQD